MNNDSVYMELKDGILYVKFKKKEIDATLAKEMIDQRLSFVDGQTFPIIVDGSEVKELTKSAREALSSEKANQHTVALAVIVRNPVTRTIANFFLKFQQPRYPFRLFTELEDAREWLKKYQSDD
ncbi:MAG: hypothetical protein WA958_10165 [Tunicatimonas sp.]